MNNIKFLIKKSLGFDANPPNALQRVVLRFLMNLDIGRNVRYREIAKLIMETQKGDSSILEIGSGKVGITSYLKQRVIGMDIAFDEYPSLGYLEEHVYDGKKFELPDSHYDYVISVDTLEHVPPERRQDMILEMLRVSKRYTIVAFPTSQQSRRYEKKLEKKYIDSGKLIPNYLVEHLRHDLPDEGDVIRIIKESPIFKNHGKSLRTIRNENLKLWYLHEYLKSKSTLVFYSAMMLFRILLWIFPFLSSMSQCYRTVLVVEK